MTFCGPSRRSIRRSSRANGAPWRSSHQASTGSGSESSSAPTTIPTRPGPAASVNISSAPAPQNR
ncbi:hypothetical protein ACCD08_29435 [Telluria sp. Tellsp104]